MKLLFIGNVVYGNSCYSRYRGFIRNGINVDYINIEDYKISNFIRFVPSRMRYYTTRLKKDIFIKLSANYDFVLFDQPFYLDDDFFFNLKNSSNSKIIFHMTDDLEYLDHGLMFDFKVLKKINYIFTCNKHNIKFLNENGVKNVYYNELGFDDEYVRLINKNVNSKKISFGFIGHYEKEYAKSIEAINSSINLCNLEYNNAYLQLYGSGWYRKNFFKKKKYINMPDLFNKGYGAISHNKYWTLLNKFDIGIGLFSSMNRNNTAGRTFEIPASNTLLLTKQSDIINNIFTNYDTAIFWDEKNINYVIRHILSDISLINKISRNGFELMNDGKYRWVDRVDEIIKIITSN